MVVGGRDCSRTCASNRNRVSNPAAILPGPMPTVAVVCGSRSDLPALKGCFDVLDEYGISWEASVISAHRQPDALHAYVGEAEEAGVLVFIGAAGLAERTRALADAESARCSFFTRRRAFRWPSCPTWRLACCPALRVRSWAYPCRGLVDDWTDWRGRSSVRSQPP